jgi:hypothetical protein
LKLERRKVCTLLSSSAPRGVAYPMIPIRLSEQGLQQSSRVAEQRSLGLWPMHARRGQKHGLLSPDTPPCWSPMPCMDRPSHRAVQLCLWQWPPQEGSSSSSARAAAGSVAIIHASTRAVPKSRSRACGPGRRTEWQASSSSGIARATR